MKRSLVQGGKEESRKLNDQLTGFVETKLAGGIKGEGGRGGKGDNEQRRGATNRQTLYPQREKTGKWGCDKSFHTLPFLPSYHMVAMNTLHALTAASTHTNTI